jgi:hypothetical protein
MAWFGVIPDQAYDKIVIGIYTSPSPVKPYGSGCSTAEVAVSAVIYASPNPSMPYRFFSYVSSASGAWLLTYRQRKPLHILANSHQKTKRILRSPQDVRHAEILSTKMQFCHYHYIDLRAADICLFVVDRWNAEFLSV